MNGSGNYVTLPLASERSVIQEKVAADTLRLAALSEEQDRREKTVAQLSEEVSNLKVQHATIEDELRSVDKLWEMRRAPVQERLHEVDQSIEAKNKEIEVLHTPKMPEMPPAPGPECYQFVEGERFNGICNLVICLNLLTMYLEPDLPETLCFVLYQVYLVWYIIELALKFQYHQYDLFCGKVSIVWANYLDATIIICGVMDQWIGAGLRASGVLSDHSGGTHKVLQGLRLLRIFRFIRLLRLVRTLLFSDLAFTHTPEYELLMASIVAVNSVVMGAELQYPSPHWVMAENIFLVIYLLELFVSMRELGVRKYFTDPDRLLWNILDFTIVAGGVLDLWLVPAYETIHLAVSGDDAHNKHAGGSPIMKLMRMMRLLRVLRLAKLCKKIPPLYRLLIGVVKAIDAMKWVMILTVLTIYACAVIFCTLVTQGLLFHHIPDNANDSFGDMYKSMYSLFSLMNGEMEVIAVLNDKPIGKLMAIAFIVVSNWAILAILTSVVSDNMFHSSRIIMEEEEEHQRQIEKAERHHALMSIFEESDVSKDGKIRVNEWEAIMSDEGRRRVLEQTSGLGKIDLDEIYEMSIKIHEGIMPYKDLTAVIEDHNRTADTRSIIKVLGYLMDVPHQAFFDKQFANLQREVKNLMKSSIFSSQSTVLNGQAHSQSSILNGQANSLQPAFHANGEVPHQEFFDKRFAHLEREIKDMIKSSIFNSQSTTLNGHAHSQSNILNGQANSLQPAFHANGEAPHQEFFDKRFANLEREKAQEAAAQFSERLARLESGHNKLEVATWRLREQFGSLDWQMENSL